MAQVKTNMEEFSAECRGCRGNSKVLTELDSNKIKVIKRSKSESINLFITISVQVLYLLTDHSLRSRL